MDLLLPGLGLFFWQSVIFIALIFLLKKVAWKPILGALKEREESIETALQEADKARNEMARLTSDNENLLNEAREESNKLLREAKEIRDETINKSKEEAKEEYAKIVADAKHEIDRQKQAAIAELKTQVGDLALEISGKVLRKELGSSDAQQQYVSSLVDEAKMN